MKKTNAAKKIAKKEVVKTSVKKSPATDSIKLMAESIYKAMDATKAKNIVTLDIKKKAAFADYLLIASATSSRQVSAIASQIQEKIFKKFGRHPIGSEGKSNNVWVLIDYGDVVCHIFLDEVRDFYGLEHLWHDAKVIDFTAKK